MVTLFITLITKSHDPLSSARTTFSTSQVWRKDFAKIAKPRLTCES